MAFTVALIVAAVLTAGVASLGWGMARLRDRSEAESLRQAVEGILAGAFAYRMTRIHSTSTITNLQGDAISRRELYGIRPNEGFSVHRVLGFISGNGRRTVGPVLEHLDGASGRFDTDGTSDSVARFRLTFDEPLGQNSEVNLTVSATFEKSYAMTRRETQARYGNDAFRHEYYASAIDIPIDVLDLEVTLPEAFEATFHGVVFYGGSELIAAEETRRVGTMLNASRHSARLHVEAPKLAFNYAIYWVPLR